MCKSTIYPESSSLGVFLHVCVECACWELYSACLQWVREQLQQGLSLPLQTPNMVHKRFRLLPCCSVQAHQHMAA